MTPIRIGLDIAKKVFQVHGVDDNGTVVIRKRPRRPDILGFFASLPACLIGIEACSASHHSARELVRLGHQVRLMPGRYLKPYVQRGKSDVSSCATARARREKRWPRSPRVPCRWPSSGRSLWAAHRHSRCSGARQAGGIAAAVRSFDGLYGPRCAGDLGRRQPERAFRTADAEGKTESCSAPA